MPSETSDNGERSNESVESTDATVRKHIPLILYNAKTNGGTLGSRLVQAWDGFAFNCKSMELQLKSLTTAFQEVTDKGLSLTLKALQCYTGTAVQKPLDSWKQLPTKFLYGTFWRIDSKFMDEKWIIQLINDCDKASEHIKGLSFKADKLLDRCGAAEVQTTNSEPSSVTEPD